MSIPYHKTLQRQIGKFLGDPNNIPANLEGLFQAINQTYQHFDQDRSLIERSLELSSKELEELNKQLRAEQAIIEAKVEQRTQELKAERNKIAITLASVADAVIAVDLNRRITIFNKAAEKLTGFNTNDVLGKSIKEIIQIFDNVTLIAEDIYCPISQNHFEGIVFSKEGLKLISATGKQTFVNLLAGQINKGREVNLGCILTLHDVSKEKQLEEMKLDFVSMAVHDLRTPLTTLKGYLHIFLRDYTSDMNEAQITIFTRINIAAQRLMSLVENLLNVTRIERGATKLELQTFSWIQNIERVLSEITDQAKSKKIEINLIKPKQDLLIRADKSRINQVLMNLLFNAINYTPMGGKITVSVETNDREVITHIADSGVGIPKEAMPHLFTKFFRVTGRLEQGSKGTGLGLYIAKSIIEMHKGRIWAQSELNKGSIFSFSIPSTAGIQLTSYV